MALLRDGSAQGGHQDHLEVLLLRRPAGSAFAASAEVFPGGSVDPADLEPSWQELLDGGADQLAVDPGLAVAAIRETFEECGVLLARERGGLPSSPRALAALAPLRQGPGAAVPRALLEGMRRAGLRPAWEDLHFCAHWVTPEGLPRIFDTRFFLAGLPPGQDPSLVDQGEVDAMRWAEPGAALAEAEQGRTLLLPPTRSLLSQLKSQPSVAAALRAAAGWRVDRIQPRLEEMTSERYPGLDLDATSGTGPGGGG
ncbi:MAG: NUDIX hydrolase [Candidatus Dormibacteria bacterium]